MTSYDKRRESVHHSVEEWVRGDVHVNTIKCAWSLFKRSIIGAFHQISEKCVDRYLEERSGVSRTGIMSKS